MATWKPTTVEDIRAWSEGRYVLNPTDDEYWQQMKKRIHDAWTAKREAERR